MKFYKEADGDWIINGEIIPAGTCRQKTESATGRITIKLLGAPASENILALKMLPTDFQDVNGNYYADLAAYELATSDFFVDAALAAAEQLANRVDYLEAHAYDTLWIDFWQVGQPTATAVGQVWFNTTDTIKAWNGTVWNVIPIDFYKLYVKASVAPREVYAWSGSAMVSVSVPLTKPAVEALIYNGTDTSGAGNIDLAIKDIFTRTVGTNQQYAILNPILYKPFRLILTGGTLNATLFTGYTSNWILTSLQADYVPANTNYLWCEIRSAGQIYLFWGA